MWRWRGDSWGKQLGTGDKDQDQTMTFQPLKFSEKQVNEDDQNSQREGQKSFLKAEDYAMSLQHTNLFTFCSSQKHLNRNHDTLELAEGGGEAYDFWIPESIKWMSNSRTS